MTSKPNFAFDPKNVPADISPVIASLIAGRCTARLYFHMQQAVLLGSSYDPPQSRHESKAAGGYYFRSACDTVEALQRLTYSMRTEIALKQRLRNELDRVVLGWKDACSPERRLSCVDAANERFAKRPYDSTWHDLCHDVIEELVTPHYSALRNRLLDVLRDIDCRVFELGESIEQGLCRPDIYRHLHNTGNKFILPTEVVIGEPEEEDELEVDASGDIRDSAKSDDEVFGGCNRLPARVAWRVVKSG